MVFFTKNLKRWRQSSCHQVGVRPVQLLRRLLHSPQPDLAPTLKRNSRSTATPVVTPVVTGQAIRGPGAQILCRTTDRHRRLHLKSKLKRQHHKRKSPRRRKETPTRHPQLPPPTPVPRLQVLATRPIKSVGLLLTGLHHRARAARIYSIASTPCGAIGTLH